MREVIWYNMSDCVWFVLIMRVKRCPHCVYPLSNDWATVFQTVRCDGRSRCSRDLEDPSWEGFVRDPKVRDFTAFAGTHTSGLALRAAASVKNHRLLAWERSKISNLCFRAGCKIRCKQKFLRRVEKEYKINLMKKNIQDGKEQALL